MQKLFTCVYRHRWHATLGPHSPVSVLGILCPECGSPAETWYPQEAGESAKTPTRHVPGADRDVGDQSESPKVPGYEILRVLGRGGMGVVYEARQLSLKRLVALKMILAGGHASLETLARFRTEAEAIARVRHPHIVQAYEFGTHQGLPYLVMELVDGGSLDTKLGGVPWPASQAAQLVETLARATHCAHQHRVVHRDLKPANVLLTADGVPKIADFGLAKCLDDDLGTTRPGVIMGTPSYLAPEQAQGDAHQVGPATDVYALGAILYELLTGRPPFRGRTPLETLDQVRRGRPTPLRRLEPQVPEDLESVCLKCLARQPSSRYTAERLADALRRFQDQASKTRLDRGPTRRGVATLLAGAAGALILTALGLRWPQPGTPSSSTAPSQPTSSVEPDQLTGHHNSVFSVAFSSDGRTLLSADVGDYLKANSDGLHPVDDLTVRWWDLATGSIRLRFGEPAHAAFGIAFVPGTSLALSGGWDRTVRLWDLETGRELHRFTGHPAGVPTVAVSPDGHRAVSGCWAGEVRLWDLDGRRSVRLLGRHDKGVRCVAFDPSGRWVISGGNDQKLRLWETGSGASVRSWSAHEGGVDGVAFAPDGRLIVSAGKDKMVQLWDANTGGLVKSFRGHTDRVWSVAYSPDGRRILSGGRDQTMRLWDVATGRELECYQGHQSDVLYVAFSPDGTRAASSSQDRTVRLWRLPAQSDDR